MHSLDLIWGSGEVTWQHSLCLQQEAAQQYCCACMFGGCPETYSPLIAVSVHVSEKVNTIGLWHAFYTSGVQADSHTAQAAHKTLE